MSMSYIVEARMNFKFYWTWARLEMSLYIFQQIQRTNL